jgi:hypothetical protein
MLGGLGLMQESADLLEEVIGFAPDFPRLLALYEKKISRSLKLNICVIDLNQLL